MQTNATYSGISAKIRAMSANLISSHMYEEITTLSSVPEFTAYLCEKTTYGSYLKKADARLLHRGEIETFLSRGVYEDFKKLYRFADNNQRKYLDLYFKSFEIEMLKKCIRHIYNSKDKENDILYSDDFFLAHSGLNFHQLSAASDINGLIDLLDGSEYRETISIVAAYPGSSVFDYDLALNTYYYQNIWRTLNRKCTGCEADVLIKIYGTRIDMLNLASIYRGKFHFRLDNAKVLELTIPCNYKIKEKDISGLVSCVSTEEFNSILCRSYYGKHFGIENSELLMKMYEYVSYAIDMKTTKEHPYSIAAVFSYLAAKEDERKKLTRALESIRYGLNQRQILEYINGGLK